VPHTSFHNLGAENIDANTVHEDPNFIDSNDLTTQNPGYGEFEEQAVNLADMDFREVSNFGGPNNPALNQDVPQDQNAGFENDLANDDIQNNDAQFYPNHGQPLGAEATVNAPPMVEIVTDPHNIEISIVFLVRSVEHVAMNTTYSINLLNSQVQTALGVYLQCVPLGNEAGRARWEQYLAEVRDLYDSIRDVMWGALRLLVQRLARWVDKYRTIIPETLTNRAIAVMGTARPIKEAMDRFVYPSWDAMVVENMIRTVGNHGNA
jgi:hypothetical protein